MNKWYLTRTSVEKEYSLQYGRNINRLCFTISKTEKTPSEIHGELETYDIIEETQFVLDSFEYCEAEQLPDILRGMADKLESKINERQES